ncbi:MAG: hypothetical protein HZA17_05705 [Nitrospirae bacterium]|nr:hypothetical protein [Nitrospirota bacterium]
MANQTNLFKAQPGQQEQVEKLIIEIIDQRRQPSAWELVQEVEKKVGVLARWAVRPTLISFQEGKELTAQGQSYVRSLLESEDLMLALLGTDSPSREIVPSIDELIHRSLKHKGSEQFREMIDFMARFREYAPYNNMLVRIQDPTCSFYATGKDWKEKFDRNLKEDARPMLILAPMHPVMLVYALDQTEGQPLPEKLQNFARYEGAFQQDWLKRVIDNAARDRIKIVFKTLSSTNAGFATFSRETHSWKMRIVIHDELDEPSRFGILCHELAHIYLGHLGTDKDHWWPSRQNLNLQTVEIEAESVAHIVTTRLGLSGFSEAYLAGHIKSPELPESVSMDLIAKVSGKLEQMTKVLLPKRREKPRKKG